MPALIKGDTGIDKVADGSITTAKIADTAITAAKLRKSVSSNIAWSVSAATAFTHGLGLIPILVDYRLVCLTAEAGYAVGDLLDVGAIMWNRADGTPVGFLPRVDATAITVAFNGSGPALIPKTGGAIASCTSANWALVITALG